MEDQKPKCKAFYMTSEHTRDPKEARPWLVSISIISELNKEFPAIWLVERFLIWRYIQLFRERLSNKTVRDNAEKYYG